VGVLVGTIILLEEENGTYVECTGAHSDRSTLYRYRRHVGRWIRVHIEINFYREARADIFRIVFYSNCRFYLAFAAHFGNKDAWPLEATAVAVFSVLVLVGIRVAFALIAGYLLHGVWDGIHEFNALAGSSLLSPRQTTSVPLAYGFFCATYDVLMAAYFYTRRNDWQAAWSAGLAVTPLRN